MAYEGYSQSDLNTINTDALKAYKDRVAQWKVNAARERDVGHAITGLDMAPPLLLTVDPKNPKGAPIGRQYPADQLPDMTLPTTQWSGNEPFPANPNIAAAYGQPDRQVLAEIQAELRKISAHFGIA